MSDEAYENVIEYHQRTKHTLQKYAAGPEALDWEAQPDPFRRFEGTQHIALPLTAGERHYAYADIVKAVNAQQQPLCLESLGSFFQLSLGLTAWKQYGTDRWSLRCNPSSGNLHPTEAYVILPELEANVAAGVYHYYSYDHCLEQRCVAADVNTILESDTFLLALSSIHWREAWKYGERAYRYCQLDAGHAMASIRLSAAIHGWQVELISSCSDAQLESLIGLDRVTDFDNVEKEKPDLLVSISPTRRHHSDLSLESLLEVLHGNNIHWQGTANLLDPAPMYQWPVIDEVSLACRKTDTMDHEQNEDLEQISIEDMPTDDSVPLILQRRSAQAFDPNHQITFRTLQHILEVTLTQTSPHLFAGMVPNIHLLVFVHRVDGLASGLYMLTRNAHARSG